MSDLQRMILGLFLVLATRAGADTGQLREVVVHDGLKVLVFTSPTPLRAGPIEVAALVTQESDGAPLAAFDLEVLVRQADWDDGRSSISHAGAAISGDAFNRKASFELEEPGTWLFEVRVRDGDREVEVVMEVDAGEPMPAWWSFLPIILVCLLCMLLIIARDRLVFMRSADAV